MGTSLSLRRALDRYPERDSRTTATVSRTADSISRSSRTGLGFLCLLSADGVARETHEPANRTRRLGRDGGDAAHGELDMVCHAGDVGGVPVE